MKKVAFLTEPRKHKALKFVLENFLSILPDEWYVQINHGTHNIDYIKNAVDESEIISNADSIPSELRDCGQTSNIIFLGCKLTMCFFNNSKLCTGA